MIVGDKKQIDMKALAKYGKIIEVKESELFKNSLNSNNVAKGNLFDYPFLYKTKRLYNVDFKLNYCTLGHNQPK
jgi:hypothetical protein